MEAMKKIGGSWGKKILIAFVALFLIGGAGFWYIMNEEFADTSSAKAAYTAVSYTHLTLPTTSRV